MNRREFLKCVFGLAAGVVGAKLIQPAAAATAHSVSTPGTYGAGVYGQDTYSGYQVFVPLVQRGGQ
jgi:hypothetical protein